MVDHDEMMRRNTQHLMNAVSSLPELQVGGWGGGWGRGGMQEEIGEDGLERGGEDGMGRGGGDTRGRGRGKGGGGGEREGQ